MSKVTRPRNAAERRQRLQRILEALDTRYPNVTCALSHSSPWQLLVATILSAQCTDERVNMVTPDLFRRFPAIEDLAAAEPAEVAQVIRSTGFFNNKARNIVCAARAILADHHGQVPRTMDELLAIPGAARKTANVVLGTAYGIPSGVVVDTHVARISARLDLTRQSNPVKIEQDLISILPQDRWIQFSHQVIHFGRELCQARKPKCSACPIERDCYAKDKNLL